MPARTGWTRAEFSEAGIAAFSDAVAYRTGSDGMLPQKDADELAALASTITAYADQLEGERDEWMDYANECERKLAALETAKEKTVKPEYQYKPYERPIRFNPYWFILGILIAAGIHGC